MSRRVQIAASGVCLLLFALTLYAWARSYLPRNLAIEADRGRLFLVFWEGGNADQPYFDPGGRMATRAGGYWDTLRRSGSRVRPDWELLGFGTVGGPRSGRTLRLVAIPLWFLALATAGGAAACLTPLLRQRRRFKRGQCARCGYDLRASPGPKSRNAKHTY
jgi:hypothetical protein